MTDILRHVDLARPQPIKTPRPFVRPVPIRNPGPGCVLYLAWDSPGAGGVWKDRSGKGNHGTINGATWSDTPWGRGLDFDGVDDYVEIPDDDSLDATDGLTLSLWIKLNTIGSYQRIIHKGNAYVFWDSLNDFRFSVYDGTVWHPTILGYPLAASLGLRVGKWAKVDCTYRSGVGSKIYVNGQLAVRSTAYTGSINVSIDALFIGSNAGSSPTNGSIALVRVYNRALSSAEIAQHYWEETPYA